MIFLIGALFVAVLVRMLLIVVPLGTETMRHWRLPAQMLLLGVPALVVQTDVLAILALASSATAIYELLLIIA